MLLTWLGPCLRLKPWSIAAVDNLALVTNLRFPTVTEPKRLFDTFPKYPRVCVVGSLALVSISRGTCGTVVSVLVLMLVDDDANDDEEEHSTIPRRVCRKADETMLAQPKIDKKLKIPK